MPTPPLVTTRVRDHAARLVELVNQRPHDRAAILSAARDLHGEAEHADNRLRFVLYAVKTGEDERHLMGLTARAGVALPADF